MSEPMTLDGLRQQLERLQASRVQLEANLQAQNGAIQFCQHLIAELEKAEAQKQPALVLPVENKE